MLSGKSIYLFFLFTIRIYYNFHDDGTHIIQFSHERDAREYKINLVKIEMECENATATRMFKVEKKKKKNLEKPNVCCVCRSIELNVQSRFGDAKRQKRGSGNYRKFYIYCLLAHSMQTHCIVHTNRRRRPTNQIYTSIFDIRILFARRA